MIYKTQVFSEQQLKDLPKGKEVVTIESVKKDENYADKIFPNERVRRIYFVSKNAKELFRIGDVVQAVNEKSEKQWYCPICNKINLQWDCNQHPESNEKPLLVRLGKTEDKHAFGKEYWLKTWKAKKWKS